MSTRFWWFGFCLISILTVHSKAFASTGETYGYGSRASALGNTMLGGIQDGYSTFYNPAANSANSGLRLSLGVAYAKPSFLEIKDIVVGNTAVAAETGDVLGSVKNDDYLDHLGQTVGASLNFGEKWKLLTVGLTGSLPITRLAYLDTGEAFRPEYFGYRSRTQRPQVYASMSVSPFQNFYMGTGIAISTNLAANTTLYATTNPGWFGQLSALQLNYKAGGRALFFALWHAIKVDLGSDGASTQSLYFEHRYQCECPIVWYPKWYTLSDQ